MCGLLWIMGPCGAPRRRTSYLGGTRPCHSGAVYPQCTQRAVTASDSLAVNRASLVAAATPPSVVRVHGTWFMCTLPHLHRDCAHRCPHLHRDCARRCHICTGTALTAVHIGTGDCAHIGTGDCAHICAGTAPTSAPGLRSGLYRAERYGPEPRAAWWGSRMWSRASWRRLHRRSVCLFVLGFAELAEDGRRGWAGRSVGPAAACAPAALVRVNEPPCHICCRTGLTPAHIYLHGEWAHPCHIRTGTDRARPCRTPRDCCAHRGHVCTGTGAVPSAHASLRGYPQRSLRRVPFARAPRATADAEHSPFPFRWATAAAY